MIPVMIEIALLLIGALIVIDLYLTGRWLWRFLVQNLDAKKERR